jgi:AraC-like DNA-binding protein
LGGRKPSGLNPQERIVETHNRLTLQLVKLGPVDKWGEQREEISFVFPRTGDGKVGSGSVFQSLSPGDVLVLNGKAGVSLAAQDKAGMAFWSFYVSLEDLFPLFTSREIILLPAIKESLSQWKHFAASSPLAAECHKLLAEASPQFDLSHRSQLLKVVTVILNEEFKAAHRSRDGLSRAEDHIVEVFENLSLEQVLELSVGELATKFGCSRRHLNRTFNHHFGISVAALRMEIRLLKAVALLRNPEAKVINVAQECGFNHLGLFNICFKRRFGSSPGKWREVESGVKSPQLAPAVTECTLRRVGLCPLTGGEANVAKTNAVNSIGKGSLAEALVGRGVPVNPKAVRPGATSHSHNYGGNVL